MFAKLLNIPAGYFDKVRGDSDSLRALYLKSPAKPPQVNEEILSHDFTFIPL